MYFITCMETLPSMEGDGGYTRTFGYYETYEEAKEALEENRLDMHEYMYDYALVEHIGPGIHPFSKKIGWFKFDKEKQGFYNIDDVHTIFVNFAFG